MKNNETLTNIQQQLIVINDKLNDKISTMMRAILEANEYGHSFNSYLQVDQYGAEYTFQTTYKDTNDNLNKFETSKERVISYNLCDDIFLINPKFIHDGWVEEFKRVYHDCEKFLIVKKNEELDKKTEILELIKDI